MARRRTLGYVQNEWTCPNCSTRNKGGMKTCENCGAPQPENVQFELPSEKKFVTDEKSIKAAKAGSRYPLRILRHAQPGHCGDLLTVRRGFEGGAGQAGGTCDASATYARRFRKSSSAIIAE